MYNGRRIFRPGAGMTALMVGITLLFAAVAFGAYRSRGWNWVSIGMALVAALLGVGSVIESLVLRIELTDDAMLVTELTGTKRYDINDIERIAEAKGVPRMLLLKDGRRVRLPSVGSDLGNSVRAWLKQR